MYFIPDYMAEFIQYAYYANRENEFETPSNVMIIDMGNISTTVSVFSCKKVVNVLFYEGQNDIRLVSSKYIMLGGRDFSRRVEKDLVKAFEKNRKPLSELSDSIRQRTLYDIHDKAKTVKKSLSVRGVDEASAEIWLLDADEDEDDNLTLDYTYDQFKSSCQSLFDEFQSFIEDFFH